MSFTDVFNKKEDYCKKMIKLKKLIILNPGMNDKIKFYTEEAPKVIKEYKKQLQENPTLMDKPELAEIVLQGIAWQWLSKAMDKCGMSLEDIAIAAEKELQSGGKRKTKRITKKKAKPKK